MTKLVGESHKIDSGYEETYKEMPYWLRPTAAFGVGLQSVFFVSSTFEMETFYQGETSKRIVFRSAADNQYSSIVEEGFRRKRGTKVKVEIPKDRFRELFGSSFGWDLLGSVDVFKGDGDNLYLAKIDDFVKKTFQGIENFNFTYTTVNSDRGFVQNEAKSDYPETLRQKDYKYSSHFEDELLAFVIHEKKFGSTLTIWFNDKMETDRFHKRLLLRDVLVANADFNYWKTGYLGFSWNLNSQITDKVVDLSRDNLTNKGWEWITITLLENLLPDILAPLNKFFEDSFTKYESKNEESVNLKNQYLNYCLTSLACGVNQYNVSCLKDITLTNNIASRNKKEITADKIFTSDVLYLIDGFKTDGYRSILPDERIKIEDENDPILNDKTIVWGNYYLYNALMFNFVCVRVVKYEEGVQIYKLSKKNDTEFLTLVQCEEEKYLLALEQSSFHECSRSSIYGLSKYSKIVVNKNYISGFERFPKYGTCYIYSPFSNKSKTESLLSDVDKMNDVEIKEYIRKNLSEYITPYMMQVVKSYNIDSCITEDQIENDYIRLIFDFIKVKLESISNDQ